MTNEEVLELIEKVQVLECDDPQIIVLTTPRILPLGHIEHIRNEWESLVKGTKLENVKTVVLDGGMDIKIVSTTNTPPQREVTPTNPTEYY